MALIYSQETTLGAGSTQFTLTDATGNYNVSTNPGGWGAPNIAKTDGYSYLQIQNVCDSSFITPVPPYLQTLANNPGSFGLLGGVNYAGGFGTPVQNPLYGPCVVNMNTFYGIDKLPDGLYTFTAKIVDIGVAPTTLASTYVEYVLSTVDIDCCISTLANEILNSTCPTNEKKKKFNNLIMWKNALTYGMACENYSAVCSALAKLTAICNNEGGCGCGC
jgi:hypothetical protein